MKHSRSTFSGTSTFCTHLCLLVKKPKPESCSIDKKLSAVQNYPAKILKFISCKEIKKELNCMNKLK